MFAAPGETRKPEPGVLNKILVALSAGVSARWIDAFDVAERLYVNNLYPEQHVLPSAMQYSCGNLEAGASQRRSAQSCCAHRIMHD